MVPRIRCFESRGDFGSYGESFTNVSAPSLRLFCVHNKAPALFLGNMPHLRSLMTTADAITREMKMSLLYLTHLDLNSPLARPRHSCPSVYWNPPPF